MKLRQVSAYRAENVPDHILQEIIDLADKFTRAITPLMDSEKPNQTLSAVNFMLAAVTKTVIIDDIKEQKRAALLQAKGIIGNIAMMNGMSVEEFFKQ